MWDPAFDFINGLAGRNDIADSVGELIATWFGILVFVIAGVGAIYLLRKATAEQIARTVVPIGVTLALTFVVSRGIRAMALLERPFDNYDVTQLIGHASGISFPSNHATAAFATAFTVAVFLSRSFGSAIAVFAALSGLSRIFVGVHWSWDILGGVALAAVCTTAVWYALRWAEATYDEPWRWAQRLPIIGTGAGSEDR